MDDKTIKKGTIINALGIAGKALLPILFLLISRIFGAINMGIFFLGFIIMDMTFSFTFSGVKDGVVLFTARHTHENNEKETYRSLINAFSMSILISIIFIIGYHLVGRSIVLNRYPDGRLAEILEIMIWTLPLYAIPNIIASAAKGLLIMHWEALLIGFLRPLLLCLTALSVYFTGTGLQGLAYGYLFSTALLFISALIIFKKYFSYKKMLQHIGRPFWKKEMLKFIIPQNLNMSFNTLITNLDVIMLGFFKTDPSLIGYYGMGAQIVRNIRQIKIAFSGIFGPIITKLHSEKNTQEIESFFAKIVFWALSIALPILIIVGLFRTELLQLFHDSFTGKAYFMLILLIPPFLSCLLGLAGDIIVMTGHSMWNLFNSITVAVLNLILNYFLIPVWGLTGAALATAISATIVYFLQLLEARFLLSIHLRLRIAFRPFLYLILPSLMFFILRMNSTGESIPARIIKSALLLLLYIPVAIWDRRKMKQNK